MNGLREAIDHTMLGWVKPELDEVLRQARIELEAFVETPDDPGRMRLCAGYLHQAQGTLRMVELYAPAMVVEEMELLADTLREHAAADHEAASATLMRGMLLLPDYLERLQGGHRDIPIVLMPLLNELRGARGQPRLSESMLFAPDLGRDVPETSDDAAAGLDPAAASAQLQQALQDWPATGSPVDAGALTAATAALAAQPAGESQRRMLWVAARVAEALADGAFQASAHPALRQVFAGVERELRESTRAGRADGGSRDGIQEATRQLLYHATHSGAEHPALEALREAFDLQAPSAAEIEHARGSLGGRNRALLDTVSAAVKEDLLRVKDALDLHLRTGSKDIAGLAPQVETLAGVADTLGMLGLDAARGVVQRQREVMDGIVSGSVVATEDALLDVAGALLYVDATLDDQVSRLGSEASETDGDDTLAFEARQSMVALVRESIANFSDARQALVAFVETSWDHAELQEVPRLLAEVGGALAMLELPAASSYLTGVRLYTERELIARKRVPNGRQLDTFADALASLEYYLEALREQRSNRTDILAIAQARLEQLGYWPLPGDESIAVQGQIDDDAASLELDIDVDRMVFGLEPAADPATPSAPIPAPVEPTGAAQPGADLPPAPDKALDVAGGFVDVGDEIDDEIREVFLEEFAGEIENLDALLPPWRQQPDNLELLRPIRRVFHTLKGSGRLVGARALGEFSWAVESMLNRVLEGRAASPAVVAMVDQAFYALPELLAVLRGHGSLRTDLDAMQASATRIAAGDDSMPAQPAPLRAEVGTPAEPEIEATVEIVPVPDVDAAADTVPEPVSATVEEADATTTLDIEAAVDTDDAQALTGLEVEAAPAAAAEVEAGPEAGSEPPAMGFTDTVPASVDELLLEILDSEVQGHVQTVGEWLVAVERGQPADHEKLLRALHTMHGAFSMAEVPAIGSLLAPAEEYARRLIAAGSTPEHDAPQLLASVAEAALEALQQLHGPEPRISRNPALVVRVEDLRDRLPEAPMGHSGFDPLDPQDLDDEADEAERLEAERLEAERLEAERLEAERLEAERLEAERLEAERLEAERLEAERLEAERLEAERLEAERLEAERLEAERLEAERREAERREAERLEAERLEAERLEAERLEAERLEAEQARLAAEQAAREASARLAAEHLEAERQVQARLVEKLAGSHLPEQSLELRQSSLEAALLEQERLAAERRAFEQTLPGALSADSAHSDGDAAWQQSQLDAGVLAAERIRFEHEEADRRRLDGRGQREGNPESRVTPDAGTTGADTAPVVEAADASPVLEALSPPIALVSANTVETTVSAEDPDAPLSLEGLDPELIDIFVEEGIDLLDHADGLLAQLREAPDNRDAVSGLQRDLHTLKGGARMAGLMEIGELGHAMETLLEAVAERKRDLARADVILLERGFDRLHTMVTRAGERRAIGPSHDLVEAFGGKPVVAVPDVVPAPAPGPVPVAAAQESADGLAPLSEPLSLEDTLDDEDNALRGSQEQVRIRADLLDKLVTYAGEVAIYRARLEQQLGAFRSAMTELGQTNTRLRDQLRRLDIETEAQIVARYRREGDSVETAFDPLELDRFSTLQQLSRALGETAADFVSLQQTLDEQTRQYESLLTQQSRVSSDLQEGLMRTRMVPFDGMVPRLRRVVRQAAQDTGKQVELKLEGTHGELDRNVLERMVSPLEHMLRNAVAHGLENPDARRAAGKAEEGRVHIAVRREGSEVVLEVGDDGAGLDRAAIRRRGEERGLLEAGANVTDAELDALILQPGFSTATEVSRLAGRGVGMDVVASEVRQLGGTFDIRSRTGTGTTFTLRLPQTLAVTQAAFVRIGEASFAVPIASVRGVGRIGRDEARTGSIYRYGGEDYQIHDLGRLIGQPAARAEGQLQLPLLLIRAGELRAAVAVDEIIGNREIVVKPVGPQITSIPGIFGATIMGDGRVVVILDIAPLVRRQNALGADAEEAIDQVDTRPEARTVPVVMVVDDSVTMRKVTGRVLERQGFDVMTARDGLDALERMDERVPDLMLLDIEMPRMDGYELATVMKSDPRLRDVVIMMITSRSGEKHRQRAFEIGVERYLGKPYQEPELLRHVYELLKLERNDE